MSETKDNWTINEGGIKYDSGKEPMNLLAGSWLKGIAQVLAFGAKKYHAWNWRKGIQYSRLFDAAQRHLFAFNDGEDNDKETGLPHLLHASCCLMFLYVMTKERKDLDDRYGMTQGFQSPIDKTEYEISKPTCEVRFSGKWIEVEDGNEKIIVFSPDDQEKTKRSFLMNFQYTAEFKL